MKLKNQRKLNSGIYIFIFIKFTLSNKMKLGKKYYDALLHNENKKDRYGKRFDNMFRIFLCK